MIAEPEDIGQVQPTGTDRQSVARQSQSAGTQNPQAAEHRGPTVLRMTLGSQLRGLRERSGITGDAAAHAIRGSHAKISRLELGRTGFKERDVRDLLTLYGVHDIQEREQFFELARRANQPGWWHGYNDLLPSWFEPYLGLEQAATKIRTYEAQLFPGILQTPECAGAVVALGYADADTQRRVDVRTQRQEILHRLDAPTLWAVIDEGVLHRPIGGVDVHRAQIEHVISMAELPNVIVQVLPFAAGGHAAVGSSFSILRFSDLELPDIVYLEYLTSALYLDRSHEQAKYLTVMDQLSVQALPPTRSIEVLREHAAKFQ